MSFTPPRKLTPDEHTAMLALAARIDREGHPATYALLHELIVARGLIACIRGVRRCLPRHANEALDEAPHRPRHAVEFPHD